MRVKDLMVRDVVTAKESSSAREVARLMRERNVGCVVIVDDEKRPLGIVNDRQIALHVVGDDRHEKDVPIREIMTRNPVTCGEDDSLFEAAQSPLRAGPFRRMPVVDADGCVCGILSIADLALAAHALLEPVLAETEAGCREAQVEGPEIERELKGLAPPAMRR